MPDTRSPSLPSSPSPPRMDTLEDEAESVRIAIRALGDMKKGARCSSSPTNNHASTTVHSPSAQQDVPPDFVSRVSNLPLVNTALRAYEQGKASSRVVKYGAEMMESSVKSISRPVIERLPVEQLDGFACRQLDRLERYRRPSSADSDRMQVDETPRYHHLQHQSFERSEPKASESNDVHDPALRPHELRTADSRTPTPGSQAHDAPSEQSRQAVVHRSRWQAVLLEAGGIGAAVSEESMRRLKYCLQWLHYATTHIDAQIVILRDFIASLQPDGTIGSSLGDSFVSPTHMRTLTDVRKDVVQTIRQVVDVVSKYAGGALPEPARARVRGFILHLPQRWASANVSPHMQGIPDGAPGANSAAGASAGGTGSASRRGRAGRHLRERSAGGPDRSLSGTPASSRASSPITIQRPSGLVRPPTASAVTRAAQHILTLATESLDMMRGVTGVVKESLDRADAWVERLRIIGLQRQHDSQDAQEPFEYPFPPTSPHQSSSSISTIASTSLTSSFTDYRYPLPGLSSTPSTPAQASTPFSLPSTPAPYASPDEIGRGIQLMEGPSLSDLRLDGDDETNRGQETPRSSVHDKDDAARGKDKDVERVWEKRARVRDGL